MSCPTLRWVRGKQDRDRVHYAPITSGFDMPTLCGTERVGERWRGQDAPDPELRCGDCVVAKLVATGEIRMVGARVGTPTVMP